MFVNMMMMMMKFLPLFLLQAWILSTLKSLSCLAIAIPPELVNLIMECVSVWLVNLPKGNCDAFLLESSPDLAFFSSSLVFFQECMLSLLDKYFCVQFFNLVLLLSRFGLQILILLYCLFFAHCMFLLDWWRQFSLLILI